MKYTALGLTLLLALACNDTTGPGQLSDPASLNTELDAVDAAFETPVFESFDRLGNHITTSAGALARSATIVIRDRAGNELTTAGGIAQPSAANAQSARELLTLAAAFQTMSPQDTFLPDSVLGTYEWDVNTDQYAKTARTGAPANTVRFILYAIDPITDLPIEPLDEVGHVDLTDNQPAGANTYSLGVTVRDSVGTTTYLDYDITVMAAPAAFTANAAGYLGNGLTGPAQRRLDFSVQLSATGTDSSGTATVDAQFSLTPGAVMAEVHDSATVTPTFVQFSRDFRFHRPGEVIHVRGSVYVQTGPGGVVIAIDVTVHVNGRLFATVEGNVVAVTVTGPGGRQLTAQELAVLNQLLDLPNDLFDVAEDLFEPAENTTP
jgi:hypothetical protein